MTTDVLTPELVQPAVKTDTLTPEPLRKMNACWRAANYPSVGRIHLYDNLLGPITIRSSPKTSTSSLPSMDTHGWSTA
jgi:hypothetical protein